MHQIDTVEFNRMMKTSILIRTLQPTTSELYFAQLIFPFHSVYEWNNSDHLPHFSRSLRPTLHVLITNRGSPVLPVMLQCTPAASARHIPGPRNTPKLIPSNLSAAAAVHKPYPERESTIKVIETTVDAPQLVRAARINPHKTSTK